MILSPESRHSDEYAADFECIKNTEDEFNQNYSELIGLEIEILNSENE